MKTIALFTGLLFFFSGSYSQVGINTPWTWTKGDQTAYVLDLNPSPVGVESIASRPDPRNSASTFTDNNGNFWLYGGISDLAFPQNIMYNDLWKFDPLTNIWTWMKGDGGFLTPITLAPVYGIKGNFNIANNPGCRYGASSWSDNLGNLWLFGGYGYGASGSFGYLNDLWKYNIASNMWAWMKGSSLANSAGIYGTSGIEDPANVPPPRHAGVSWSYNDGSLWLFSGADYDTWKMYNDIWKFNPVTNNWTWVKGTFNSLGSYGTQGVPNASNIPTSRYFSSGWTESGGSLWMFGGHASFNFPEYKNDIWRFDPSTSMWTWEKGSSGIGALATYGTQGAEAEANTPASRFGMMTSKDLSGNFWLVGGFDAGTLISNELWKFNPATKQWGYMKGNGDVSGIYGALGIPSSTNRPGSRSYGSMWTDESGKFWLYGGYGRDINGLLGDLTDMWMINSLSLLPDRHITLRGRNENQNNIIEWNVNDASGISEFIIERSSNGTEFEPVKKFIPSPARLNYLHIDNPLIRQTYYYKVKARYRASFSSSNIIPITLRRQPLVVFPNPVTSILNVKPENGSYPSSVTIYNSAGMEVINKDLQQQRMLIILDVSDLPAGYYRIKVNYDNDHQWTSFIK